MWNSLISALSCHVQLQDSEISIGFNLFYLDHAEHELYHSLDFLPLPHIHHSFSRIYLRPKEIHTWGMLWPGDRRFPHSPHSARGRVTIIEQPRWAKWAANHSTKSQGPGTLGHRITARCTATLAVPKWINYTAKPSASGFNSSHKTNRIQASMKTGHYCNKAKKI